MSDAASSVIETIAGILGVETGAVVEAVREVVGERDALRIVQQRSLALEREIGDLRASLSRERDGHQATRTLLALLGYARRALDEVGRLRAEVDRLRAASPQPPPTGGRGDVWAEVIAAIGPDHPAHALAVERRALGIERYGCPLQHDDGRDPWRDLREELLDAAAYAWRVGWYPLAWLLLWWAPWARRP